MGAWLIRDKKIFTDFDSDLPFSGRENQIGSKWNFFSVKEDGIFDDSSSFLKPAFFIKFAIVRKIGLRDKA